MPDTMMDSINCLKKTKLSKQEIIDIVFSYDDGFDFAQLQSGLRYYEINEILKSEGFFMCCECGNYSVHPSKVDGDFNFCTQCKVIDDCGC